MSITCKICNTEFEKIIPWQHLRTHNVTSAEYKASYGPLYSAETLAKQSGRQPANKGIAMNEEQKAILREKAIARNKQWSETNTHPIVGRKHNQSTIEKIKEKRKHQVISSESISKGIATKKEKGIEFGGFKGKKHTAESKQKISKSSKLTNSLKSSIANDKIIERMSQTNLTLLNDISNNNLQLCCNVCQTKFVFTKQYFHESKFTSSMCPGCFPRNTNTSSAGEKELYDFVKNIYPDAVSNYRQSYHSKEIDVFVPSINVGFEYNGLYWHSEPVLLNIGQNPKKDFTKQQYFAEQNIRLIQIFEDEWVNKQEIVKSRIKHILQNIPRTIFARKCVITKIDSKTSATFLNKHHIMGNGRSNERYGLYYQSELVAVMSFTKSNISRKLQTWELNRFASKVDTNIVGGASKLFKMFVNDVNPESIISYSDNRWSNGNLYSRLGFDYVSSGFPSYWYTAANSIKRIHRYALRKNSADNPLLTEVENRALQGYSRIWDSGHTKWVWNKKIGH